MGSEEALMASFFQILYTFLPRANKKRSEKARARKFGEFVTALGGAGGMLGIGLAVGGKALELAGNSPLSDERDSLKKEFANLDSVKVVVIDDIDRLDGSEIRTLFRIIKAIADLPNVSYLLLFDRSHVSLALGANEEEEDVNSRGEQYLDKIVSVMFDLPQFDAGQRKRTLMDLANEFLGELEVEDAEAQSRTALVFENLLLPAFDTVRQMKKYVRTVAALLPTVNQEGYLGVDPADFLTVEYIRQREPDLYSALVQEVMPQAGGTLALFSPDSDLGKKIEKRRIESLPESGARRDLAEEALECLGREVTSAGMHFTIENSAAGFAERRFACGYCTMAYFGFDSEKATMPESLWSDLKSRLASGGSLDFLFEEFEVDERRRELTRALGDRIPQHLDVDESKLLFRRLMEWANDRPKERESFLGGPMAWPIVIDLLGTACLKNLTRTEATSYVAGLVDAGEFMVPLARFVSSELMRRKEVAGGGDWSHGQNFDRAVAELQIRLKAMVEDDSIYDLASPYDAIVAWNRLTPDTLLAEWKQELFRAPAKLALYVNKFLGSLKDDSDGAWHVSEDDPLTQAIRNIDISLLDENGVWARDKHLSSAKRSGTSGEDDSEPPTQDQLGGR